MLPFLRKRKEAAVSTAPTTIHMGGEPSPENKAARDLIEAIESKNEAGVMAAFKACFQECESEPHEEAGEAEEAPEQE